ncbi:preprotein translocase subunit SecE [Sediminibacterium magnilacihabitans]|jgi:preprotein translocase subunit SecE|nr:preprotein translocase subunit SecE [Sediminibacterium magnilacihabitans]
MVENNDLLSNCQIVELPNCQINLMNKITTYFKESYQELMEKVTWPTWLQLQQSTVIVLVATIIITAMVWAMDFASNQVLKLIYSLFK